MSKSKKAVKKDPAPAKEKKPIHRFKKGEPRPKNAGRKKGSVNKVTRTLKEAIAHALADNQDLLVEWLKKSGSRSGTSGVLSFATLAEFVLPKMSRTEHSGKDGEPMQFIVMTSDEATKLKLNELENDQKEIGPGTETKE